MNYLHDLYKFDTVEEGEKNLEEALHLRDSMGGALYWGIVNDDCMEIQSKLTRLKLENNYKK